MPPNIYLDIDGVLLANDKQASLYVKEFLTFVLEHYPDTTYWLTTHCMTGDATEPIRNVGRFFDAETVELMKQIKPTAWKVAKTEAIDFSKPFLWFDDDLYPDEEIELEKQGKKGGWVEVDLKANPSQLKLFMQSFPLII